MLVREGDRVYLEAPAKAEAAANVVTPDYYTQLPQIRLTGNSTGRPTQPETPTEVTLDGNDVAKLVECVPQASQPEYAIGSVRSDLEPPRHVPPDFPVRPQRTARLSGNTQDCGGGA